MYKLVCRQWRLLDWVFVDVICDLFLHCSGQKTKLVWHTMAYPWWSWRTHALWVRQCRECFRWPHEMAWIISYLTISRSLIEKNKTYSKKIEMFENVCRFCSVVVFGLLAGTEEVFLKVASGEMDGEYQVPESCSDRFRSVFILESSLSVTSWIRKLLKVKSWRAACTKDCIHQVCNILSSESIYLTMTQWNDAISWGLQDWASGVRSDGSRHVTHLAACLSLNLKARSRLLGSDKKLGSFTWFTNGLLTGSVFLSVCWQVGFRCKRRCLGILGCIYSPRATNRGSSWSVPDMDGVIWRLGAGLCVQKEEHLGTNHNKSTQIFDSESSGWCERLVGFWQQKWGFGYSFHPLRSYTHIFRFLIRHSGKER